MFSGQHIRQSFVEYFTNKNHKHILSSSLVPYKDPSILFTNAGMNQFKKYFLGEDEPDYSSAVTCQKVMRAGGKHNDLENVGYTKRHHTFFEMLGNFSFGDYFKEHAILYAWEWLTTSLQIPENRLVVSIFNDDDESLNIWHKKIGLPYSRIVKLGEKDNFWSMGDVGPCGPCSEIHYLINNESKTISATEALEKDTGDYLEIWNLVFMQFERKQDGSLANLPKPSIDTGCGLERISSVLQKVESNFDTDLFSDVIKNICKIASYHYKSDYEKDVSVKVIADHVRGVAFSIADGVLPGNEGRNYVIRRIIRRALRHARILNMPEGCFSELIQEFIPQMSFIYPELEENKALIYETTKQEEIKFKLTLKNGIVVLDELILKAKSNNSSKLIAQDIFKLYDTYGFPPYVAAEILANEKLFFDQTEFDSIVQENKLKNEKFKKDDVPNFSDIEVYQVAKAKFKKQEFTGYHELSLDTKALALFQEDKMVLEADTSKTFSVFLEKTPFYATSGGQVGDTGFIESDTFRLKVLSATMPISDFNICHCQVIGKVREKLTLDQFLKVKVIVSEQKRQKTSLNHTATHLLHSALRQVLGPHVRQAGSQVDFEKLRFDFSGVTSSLNIETLDELEELVNEQIAANQPVIIKQMAMAEALNQGALAFFGDKYGDNVRVVKAGKKSLELCGGTHAKFTGDICVFKIVSEQSIASGIRRIEAFTGKKALHYIQENFRYVQSVSHALGVKVKEIEPRVKSTLKQIVELSYSNSLLKSKILEQNMRNVIAQKHDNKKFIWLEANVDDNLKNLANIAKKEFKKGVSFLWQAKSTSDKQSGVLAVVVGDSSLNEFSADILLNKLLPLINGKGGGSKYFAQGRGLLIDKSIFLKEIQKMVN